MKNTTNPIKLYVVQPNDTLETIAKKFNCNTEEIVQLNPLLRVSRLNIGQPLNVVSNIRDSNEESFELDCNEVFIEHAFFVKQLALSKIYAPDYVLATNIPLSKSTDSIIKCVEYKIPLQNSYNFKQIIEEMQNNLLDFIDIVSKKDEKALINYRNTTNDLLKSFDQLDIEKNDNATITNLLKDWQMFVIKTLANKNSEAEELFLKIERIYSSVAKNM